MTPAVFTSEFPRSVQPAPYQEGPHGGISRDRLHRQSSFLGSLRCVWVKMSLNR
jgi:hypothetical protein